MQTQNKTLKPKHLPIIILLVIVTACVPRAPIPVIVTPTAQASPTINESVDTSVEESTPIAATPEGIIVLPTVDSQSVPTLDQGIVSESSPTPQEVASASEPTSEGQILGSIVDEGYVQPPTETPRPTLTATDRPPQQNEGNEVAAAPAATITSPATLIPGSPRLDRSQMGIQLYFNMPAEGWEAVMAQTGQMRVDWVKLQANWAALQPGGSGQYETEFRLFEQHVETAHNSGFKVMISIAKAPRWARNVNANEDGPPDNPQDLVDFIRLMLERFGESIDAIEVWNEPNLNREWTGALPFSGQGYMQLFVPAYNQIRAYSPDIIIITAGLAPTGDSQFSVDDRTFMQQMYNAGLASYRDVVVGIHPYGWGNAPDARCCNNVEGRGWDDDPHFFFLDNIEDYREVMLRNNHDVQMWTTEFGWATWSDFPTQPPQEWMLYNTPEAQRDYTLRAFQIGQERAYMGPMILWNLNFGNEILIGNRVELAGYSLLYPGFETGLTLQERPLYWALAQRP